MRRGLDQSGWALLVSARDQYQSTAVIRRRSPFAFGDLRWHRFLRKGWALSRVDGAAKDGNGSALSILEILNRRLDRVSLLTRRSRAAVAFEESTFSAG
jgi:hypothetical protein